MTEEREKELRTLFRDLARGASRYAEDMRQQAGVEIRLVISGGFEALDAVASLRNQRAALDVALGGVSKIRDDLIQERGVIRETLAHYQERQNEHLGLIAELSKKTPYDNEIEDLRRQNAALIAEVGTLRARLSHR